MNIFSIVYSAGTQIFQEAKQLYYAKSDFEQNKNKLGQLITEVEEKLNIMQEVYNQHESTDNSEYQQLIQELKDVLAESSQLYSSLPTQLTLIQGYQLSKEQINQDLLDTLNKLEDYKNRIDHLVWHTRNICQTVIIKKPSSEQNSKQFLLSKDQIYTILIKLKLKAHSSIKKIFDGQPFHLKSEYKFEFEMEESGSSNKNIHIFKREDFSRLGQFQSQLGFSIENLSKKNHCSLQMKNRLNFPNKRVLSNSYSETPTAAPEEQSVIITQWDQFNYSDKFQLFLVVNGKNAVEITRDTASISLKTGQELELQENDQIIFFQKSKEFPLLSYVVQNILITKKQAQSNLQNQQN